MHQFAVSSWSLDGLLASGVPLLALPAQLREQGITIFELCHFHLPSTDADYLHELREQLHTNGITLFSLLIDAGDIAAPDATQTAADIAFTQGWIRVAATLGAERVRIAAGRQAPTPAVLHQSAQHLNELAQYAATQGVQVSTENWLATAHDPDAVLTILAECSHPIGLCVDMGNAETTADKYQTLTQLLPHATSLHFKARYTPDGAVEHEDVQRCSALVRATAFDGVVTLIYDRKQNEWHGVQRLRQALMAA